MSCTGPGGNEMGCKRENVRGKGHEKEVKFDHMGQERGNVKGEGHEKESET